MTHDAPRHPGLNLGLHHPAAHEENEKLMFGFWVFLMSDLSIFGLVFATYAAMTNPVGQAGADGCLQPRIRRRADSDPASVQRHLRACKPHAEIPAGVAPRLAGGDAAARPCFSLGLEARDLVQMVADGAVPQRSGWLSAFWALVPLHGLHVAAGCLWIVVMLVQVTLFFRADHAGHLASRAP